MLIDLLIYILCYAAGALTVWLILRQKSKTTLNEAIARSAVVKAQIQSFTKKIGNNTEGAIEKFSDLLISISRSINGTSKVVDSIRAKMSSCVVGEGDELDEKDLKEIQNRYGIMLQEIMAQLNMTIERKKEDIEKLDHIRDRADEIKPFSSEISSIAYATRMLSLNASIEAARAGKHGRTFEVVASEVRQLAHRATDSADEMGTILEDVVAFIDTAIIDLKEAIDVESRFINATVILLQDLVMSVVDSFVSISEAVDKTLGDSSTFRDEVNGIVVNLQFEDICNQMSQHTVHLLETIQKDLEALKIGEDPNETKEGDGKHSIRDKIFNSAKDLFTMEEERRLAKAALGNEEESASPPPKSDPDRTASPPSSKEDEVMFFDDPPTGGETANDDDDDVMFFDDPPASDENDDVTFFDDPPASDENDDVTFFDDDASAEPAISSADDNDNDDDVTFFDDPPASNENDDDGVTFFDDDEPKQSQGASTEETESLPDEKKRKQKKKDEISFDDDDDVTFF